MVKKTYTPKQGDIVFLDFSPQSGHEQKGRRPGLVVSNSLFNTKTGFVMVCPITSRERKFPLHLSLPKELSTTGFVLTEHVKSMDFRARHATFSGKVSKDFLANVLALLESFY